MRVPLAHYDQLIAEELAGIISPADQAALDAAKAEFPEVYKLWEEKHAAFADKEIQEWAEQKMAPPVVSKKRFVFRYKRMMLVAAVIIPFLYLLFRWSPIPQEVYLSSSSHIQLILDNGKVIDLSYLGDSIPLDLRKHDLPIESSSGELATLYVPEGKDLKITLSESTEITINSASCLRFPLSFHDDKHRHVSVSGEAYFKVSKDAHHPFAVIVQKDTVLVLGTEFNVKNYGKANAQVALVEGKVRLQTGEKSLVLNPGVMGTFTKNGIDTATVDTSAMLSWKRGVYIYKEETLEEVFKVLARWTGKKVAFQYHPPKGKLFTGQFDKNDLREFFEGLLRQGIECTMEGERIEVKQRQNVETENMHIPKEVPARKMD
ncbi:FecR family protein [Chitinophaga niabensis]|uniref:Uncharacterized protein n=1 Tax=Chitinophaga niabensis TaxID=536979 RepID=A0A1N6JYP5_9BACT|nr:FecR domain-containing protein [Chitinophaga niabensis]SIO49349.1 protein of unknown function [Chitinophaga niabensis]